MTVSQMREDTEAIIRHWRIVLELTERNGAPESMINAKIQIVWLRGYLRALDDILQENKQSDTPK